MDAYLAFTRVLFDFRVSDSIAINWCDHPHSAASLSLSIQMWYCLVIHRLVVHAHAYIPEHCQRSDRVSHTTPHSNTFGIQSDGMTQFLPEKSSYTNFKTHISIRTVSKSCANLPRSRSRSLSNQRLAIMSSPVNGFNLQTCARPNILALQPYR